MGVLCLLSVCTSVPARVTEHRLTMSHSFERNSHFYWVPYASRLEAIAQAARIGHLAAQSTHGAPTA